jgi:hypothetical protein
MGIRRTATERDLRPLSDAARIAFNLNQVEKQVPPHLRWHYEIKADRRAPYLATVLAYDENLTLKGVWYS